jgi:hypothetical protein
VHHRREQHLHAEPVSTVVVPYDIGRARLSLAGGWALTVLGV